MNETLKKVSHIREDYKKVFKKEAYPEKIFEQIAYCWFLERRSAKYVFDIIQKDVLDKLIEKRETLGLVQMVYRHIWSYYKECGIMTDEDIKIEEKLLYKRMNPAPIVETVEEISDNSELDDFPF